MEIQFLYQEIGSYLFIYLNFLIFISSWVTDEERPACGKKIEFDPSSWQLLDKRSILVNLGMIWLYGDSYLSCDSL